MTALFFYGTLCHVPLLEAVVGAAPGALDARLSTAVLPGHLVSWVKNEAYPMIEAVPGCDATGVLFSDVTEDEEARLSYYEGAFSYHLSEVLVRSDDSERTALCYYPMSAKETRGADWVLADWVRVWGEMAVSAAKDVMARRGRYDAETAAGLRPFLMARHWSRMLARDTPTPASLRYTPDPGDVTVHERLPGFRGFFELAEFRLDHRRFDGTRSPVVTREAFLAFDAALVLPYDPKLDQVLLIEQLRFGPLWRSDPRPWVFEPIAGLVDAGERPADTARREAIEESGLKLGDLEPMVQVYASPGYSTEYFHCFLGVTDLSNFTASENGLASEHEDIRSHILPFDTAMGFVDTGEINAGPLVMMLLWLSAQRARLRAAA
ncbi:NUDIX domain-containing protein [Marivita sp. S2033]|uniref:NUDIX domain-containing protein n=1 Tax=Marivita sp. S2033 TaxID=3373187 RepID=UPI0039819A26